MIKVKHFLNEKKMFRDIRFFFFFKEFNIMKEYLTVLYHCKLVKHVLLPNNRSEMNQICVTYNKPFTLHFK